MKQPFLYLTCLLLLITAFLTANLETVPTAFNGRIIPLSAYAERFAQEHFDIAVTDPLTLLLQLQFLDKNWHAEPFFQIQGTSVSYEQIKDMIVSDAEGRKKLIGSYLIRQLQEKSTLPIQRKIEVIPGLWVGSHRGEPVILKTPDHFPWNFLYPGEKIPIDHFSEKRAELFETLLEKTLKFHQALSHKNGNDLYEKAVRHLQESRITSEEIAEKLDSQFPLYSRLAEAGAILPVLAGRNGNWYPLSALSLQTFDPHTDSFRPIPNFTAYPDALYHALRETYRLLAESLSPESEHLAMMEHLLHEGYQKMQSNPTRPSLRSYPGKSRLAIEYIYNSHPWVFLTAGLYAGSFFLFLAFKNPASGFACLTLAFALHSSLLAVRSYILMRPPVANMFETVLYVPWIAVLIAIFSGIFSKKRTIPASAALLSGFLLFVLKATGMEESLDPVQPVLDSQYWLTIHVLMVVASYGAFLLSGALSHVYIIRALLQKQNQNSLTQAVLQPMYIGTALLICGTILGGVWAAESWGRFWDWDPKESWAFISSAAYIVIVHLYRFGKIKEFGLAIGSIIGMQAVTFTWYGVNYILGTGFHSYGFGTGNTSFYYAFLIIEAFFLIVAGIIHQRRAPHAANN